MKQAYYTHIHFKPRAKPKLALQSESGFAFFISV